VEEGSKDVAEDAAGKDVERRGQEKMKQRKMQK
jgi:hypothetical protein